MTLAEWDETSSDQDSVKNKNNSKHTQSKRSLMRKKSMASSHSRRSKASGSSKRSTKSRKRRHSLASSHFSKGSKESKEENPFDNIIGKEMYQTMIDKKHYIEKITLGEFKRIEWKSKFPTFVCEVVRYMTGLEIKDYLENFEHEKK